MTKEKEEKSLAVKAKENLGVISALLVIISSCVGGYIHLNSQHANAETVKQEHTRIRNDMQQIAQIVVEDKKVRDYEKALDRLVFLTTLLKKDPTNEEIKTRLLRTRTRVENLEKKINKEN